MSDFVISVRNLKKTGPGGFGSEPGKTRFLAVPEGADPSRGQEIDRDDWVRKVMVDGENGEIDAVTGLKCGDILVFIHGYNNEPPIVIQRHRLLKKILGHLARKEIEPGRGLPGGSTRTLSRTA